MKKKISIATLIHAQAQTRAKTVSGKGVSPAIDGRSLHARVDHSLNPETGAARLRVIIPGTKKPEEYDLTRLLEKPKLAVMIAEGFRCWALKVRLRTRRAARICLNTNFADFLRTVANDVDPSCLDETFWTAFVRWLDAPKDTGEPWAIGTRAAILYSVRSCIQALIGHNQYGQTAVYLLDLSGFPMNSWPGKNRKTIPTSTLTASEKDRLVLSCLGEVEKISHRLREREKVLAAGQRRLDDVRAAGLNIPYEDIGVCAALILENFPDRLGMIDDIRALDRSLSNAVQYRHGQSNVRGILYSSFRDLVPFVVLLGLRTAFNVETLFSLRWANIKYSFDGKNVTIIGIKGRASQAQASPDNAIDLVGNDAIPQSLPAEPGVPGGLADLLDLLEQLTKRTRAILKNRGDADQLFIGVPVHSGSVRGLSSGDSGAVYSAWNFSFKAFIRDHGLTPFSLKTLRATVGEEEFQRTGDSLAVKRRLGHKYADTVRTHYTSDWMRRYGQDRIGETQELLVRWVETGGRADPRGRSLWEHAAVTPGFRCLDPYDNPHLGQRKGQLCVAYGECPSCPLAAARPYDPLAVALYIALRQAIYAGQQGRISAEGWHGKWSKILEDLNKLLALVPIKISEQAARYRVVLKPIG